MRHHMRHHTADIEPMGLLEGNVAPYAPPYAPPYAQPYAELYRSTNKLLKRNVGHIPKSP
jgi:hypothetical protein